MSSSSHSSSTSSPIDNNNNNQREYWPRNRGRPRKSGGEACSERE